MTTGRPPSGDGEESTEWAGDAAADMVWELHGLAESSGLHDAVEQLRSEGRLDGVRAALSLLELPAVAALIDRLPDLDERAADEEYESLVDDERLEAHVAALASRSRQLFSDAWRP